MKFIKFLFSAIAFVTFNAAADPIRIVTNLPAGSGPDAIARKVADQLGQVWKTPVIVDNRPGGNGVIAMNHVIDSNDPDTIYFGDFGSYTIMPIMYDRELLVRQLQPIWPGYSNIWVIAVPPQIKSWPDFKVHLKKNPMYGSWAVGSSGHLCGHELSNIIGVDAVHVPYKEYGPMFADLSNGNLAFLCVSIASSKSYYELGKLNYLAVSGDKRDSDYKTIPTINELTGRKFRVATGSMVFFTHKNTSIIQRKKLEEGIRSVLNNEELKASINFAHGFTWKGTIEDFEKQRWQEYDGYKKLIQEMNISVK